MSFKRSERVECPEDPVGMYARPDGSVYIYLPGREAMEYGIDYNDVARLIRDGQEILRHARAVERSAQ